MTRCAQSRGALLAALLCLTAMSAHAGEDAAGTRSYLTRLWNLDDVVDEDESRLNALSPHRPTYLVMRRTDSPNRQPGSPAAGRDTLTPYDLDTTEAKFQLSVKADIGSQTGLDWLGFRSVRYWLAYTQQSHWQILNTRNSEPFRETNYEPEFITTFARKDPGTLKFVNLGILHQSNGRSLPESRKWNRFYVQGGWESGSTSVLLRRWWRLAEDPLLNDNPDITDYAGLGDLQLRWEPADESQSVSMLLRSNLRLPNNHSFVQLDWATPKKVGHAGRVHLQLTSGFGESLIDYNHRQTTLGLGLSFREW